MHDELTPSPAPSIEPLDVFERRNFGGWAMLAALDEPPAGLDPWARAHLGELADVESGWPAACQGPTLVHGDVRSDNVLLTRDGVVFVDWPHAAVGNPAFDVVVWAPSVVLEGGPPPEELLSRHQPSGRSDSDAVSALLAAVSGFFVSHSLRPAPPGLPTIRPFQGAQGEVALAWLRRRQGWSSATPGRFGSHADSDSRSQLQPGPVAGRPLRRGGGEGNHGRGDGLRVRLGDGPLLPTAPDGRAESAHAGLLHVARHAGGADRTRPSRHHGDRRHVSQPGAPGQDRDHPRRHHAAGPSSASVAPGTTSSTTGSASTSRRWASGSTGWRRRCRSAGPCSPRRRPASRRTTTASTRRATAEAGPARRAADPRRRGGEKRTLKLVAQYADMCNIFGDPATVAQKVEVVRRHCADVGRDPSEVTVTG